MSLTRRVSTANSMAAAVELVSPRALPADDVADVFDDEQIARLALRDEFRQHARIRAGDEQRVRILAFLRQLAEELPVIAELVVRNLWTPSMSRCMMKEFIGERLVFRARFLGEAHLEFFQLLLHTRVAGGEDLRGENARVARAVDGHRGHRHARRHLHHGQQRIKARP